MTTPQDWIDALELSDEASIELAVSHKVARRMKPIGNLENGPDDVLYTDATYRTPEIFDFARAFARKAVAEYIKRQEVVAWQYRWLNPGKKTGPMLASTEWQSVRSTIFGLDRMLEKLRSDKIEGQLAYEVRALCVKEDA